MITNNTKRAIWSRGTMAFIMEFRTTCKPKRKEDTRYEPDFYALPYQNFYNYTLLEINDTGMQTISLKKKSSAQNYKTLLQHNLLHKNLKFCVKA